MRAQSKPRNVIFVPIAHPGCRRHTKVCKAGVVARYGELAPRILPRPSSAPAGDKPQHYIPPSPPLWIPAFAGMTNWVIRGIPRHYRSRVTSFSYQSLIPVVAGTPRYAKLELWLGMANWHRPHSSGFRRRIGVRGVLSPERRSGVAVWT